MDWGYISVAEHLLIMYEALGLASVLKGAGGGGINLRAVGFS